MVMILSEVFGVVVEVICSCYGVGIIVSCGYMV